MKNKSLIKIIHNFITDEERKSLNKWTLNNYKSSCFMNPRMNNDTKQTRFTTRHAHYRENNFKDYKVKYPEESYSIQKRLFKYFNLDYRSIIPWPHFTDGIVTTIAFPPGSCFSHVDPIYYKDTYTLHCNIITQMPQKGGITTIENESYEVSENDVLMYITSHLNHEVNEIIGEKPRILWVFGFCLNKEEMDHIFDLKNVIYF